MAKVCAVCAKGVTTGNQSQPLSYTEQADLETKLANRSCDCERYSPPVLKFAPDAYVLEKFSALASESKARYYIGLFFISRHSHRSVEVLPE